MKDVCWVELPATNLERAIEFYTGVFHAEPQPVQNDEVRRTCTLVTMRENGLPGISLTETEGFTPSDAGALVYLNVAGDIETYMERVIASGGTITRGKTLMMDDKPEMGHYAMFTDTEGNTLAFYGYDVGE